MIKNSQKKMDVHNPKMCFISSKEGIVRWDGKPIYTITGVEVHNHKHPASVYLDQPMFEQSKTGISSTRNPIINTDDCNPSFLLSLAERVLAGDIPFPEAIKTRAMGSIYEVFLNNATPRMLYENLKEYAEFLFKDDSNPDIYRIEPRLYFKSMSKRNILAFDIHDLLHHPLQLAVWPHQFQYLATAAYLASELSDENKGSLRIKKLTRLCWIACFEESLITMDNQIVSFGCLNWLSPSETPLNKMGDIRELSKADQMIGFRWHYLDTIKELYKLEATNSTLLNKNLNWIEMLGYGVDSKFQELIRSDNPRPFENLSFYDALDFSIETPKSPEELFDNAIELIRKEL